MGMILAGMTEGLGAGILAGSKSAQAEELAAQKSALNLNSQLQILEAKRSASMEALMAKMEGKIAAGGAGGKDPDIQTPESADEFAAYDTASTGDQVRQRRAIAMGGVPTRDVAGETLPTAAQADTAATGPNGEDYSDRMSRVMQHEQAKPSTYKETDQAALDDYKANAAQMSDSLRKSRQPKEAKSLAEASNINQRTGLVRKAVDAGTVGNAEGALLSDGKPAYNSNVSVATGKTTAVGDSLVNKNNGVAAKDNAEATDKSQGLVKPKDVQNWLGDERKSIDTARNDLRAREANLADIKTSATMSEAEKTAAKASLAEERANIVRREKTWQQTSEKVGAGIMSSPVRGVNGSGAAAMPAGSSAAGSGRGIINRGTAGTSSNEERIYLAQRELAEETAKPLSGAYTQDVKDKAIAGLKKDIASLTGNPSAEVDTSRMGGMKSTAPSSKNAPAAAAPVAAPAAPKAPAAPGTYKSANDVKAAYQRGEIDKAAARTALSTFGFK